MLFDVPFVSQYADLGRHEWRARGCGIASLKMVLDFYGTHILLEELLSVGLELGAYREGIGWSHGGLVSIAERSPGVYGARLTGGGFGGAIVALADHEMARETADGIAAEYERQGGRAATVLVPAPVP